MIKRRITITGSENINLYRLITLKHALKLETLGMKKRGKSAYAVVKKELNLKGSKQKVYEQLENIINIMKANDKEMN